MTPVKKGSVAGRDEFLQRIAGRLGRPAPLRAAPPRGDAVGVPEPYASVRLEPDERVELFVRNWTALNGVVRLIPRAEAQAGVAAFLQDVAREHAVTRALRWDHPELAALPLDDALAAAGARCVVWRSGDPSIAALLESAAAEASGGGEAWSRREPLLRAAETCRLGIVWPDAAVANTSTLVLAAGGGRGRSVSLVTDILFAVFRADQLVTRMGEAFTLLRERYGADAAALPSSLNLITGPSRSADIENDLTIGVHGPGKVYAAVLVD